MIKDILFCFDKDFLFYFRNKMFYPILFVYLILSIGFVVYGSDFYNNASINLYQFFNYQPAVLSLIIPALTMRLWSDEFKNNTLEIILSQPMSPVAIILGKFFAVWGIVGIMILLSFCFWGITAFMVSLDNFWVLINYIILILVAGSLCAISAAAAAFCYNTVGAFVAGLALCLITTTSDFSGWIDKLTGGNEILWMQLAKSFDFARQFDDMIEGQLAISSIVYFILLIVASLIVSFAAVDYKRS